jgi:hypothetical protein
MYSRNLAIFSKTWEYCNGIFPLYFYFSHFGEILHTKNAALALSFKFKLQILITVAWIRMVFLPHISDGFWI